MEKAFRVWDEENKEMYYLYDGKTSPYYLMIDNESWGLYKRGDSDVLASSSLGGVLMQYSGLQCMEEMPIFEGDLIVFHRGYTNTKELWGNVVLEAGAFYINDTFTGKGHRIYLKDLGEETLKNNIEVVGNIYIHKYHLKGEDTK